MKKVILLSKKDSSPYGDNIIRNGTYDTDTEWGTFGNWVISGGVATFDGLGAWTYFYQVNVTSPATNYRLWVDVVNAGASVSSIRVLSAGAYVGEFTVSGDGTYTFDFTSNTANNDFSFQTGANTGVDYAFSIDNVVLKEVL